MSHVPTWVYVLCFVLLYSGIKRCHTRVVAIERITFFPLVFIFLGLHSTVSLFHFPSSGFLLLLLGGITGALFGHLYAGNRVVRVDKQKRLIEIPGDISMLLMVMSVFAIEFFIHHDLDAHWAVSRIGVFKNAAVVLSGIVAGFSTGRNITCILRYKQAESVDLTAAK